MPPEGPSVDRAAASFQRTRGGAEAIGPHSPQTLYHIPYTLHPTPYTLHPTPYNLHPTPYTLHPTRTLRHVEKRPPDCVH